MFDHIDGFEFSFNFLAVVIYMATDDQSFSNKSIHHNLTKFMVYIHINSLLQLADYKHNQLYLASIKIKCCVDRYKDIL